jgi:uncharacterized protein with von Willebrand factor type A (vWA) domain
MSGDDLAPQDRRLAGDTASVGGDRHPPDTAAFAGNVVHFVRYLRARGLRLGSGTASDLAAVLDAVGLDHRSDVYLGFLAVITTSPAQRHVFDQAFDLFFGSGRMGSDDVALPSEHRRAERGAPRVKVPVLTPRTAGSTPGLEQVSEIRGASATERVGQRDFAELTVAEQEEVRRLISQMTWRPADARSRRRAASSRGVAPDLRRTLRKMSGPQGDLMPLAWTQRRPRRRPLVVIADISGSMERYTEMFLYFIHAAQGRLGRVESFVFPTRLTRITRELRRRQPDEALRAVGGAVHDWSGGTRIGASLAAFNLEWSRRVTRGGAIALVISDGWDTGDPELLAAEMARLSRSVHRVVWLNPLAGRPGFAPETQGMRAVLPHVDDFLAAATLNDLRGVVRLLETIPAHRGARGPAVGTRVGSPG